QVQNPKGIFYTSVTGIWQTVWLESVPRVYIRSYDVTTDIATGQVTVSIDVEGASKNATVRAGVFQAWDRSKSDGNEKRAGFALDDELQVMSPATEVGKPIVLTLDKPQLWSPDAPYLYDMVVMLEDGGNKDRCLGYFGVRKIEVKQAEDGFNRLFMNDRPLFQFGPLDQGWWPDGLYTAPTDEALRYDIEMTKAFGFNMCRKHVKVEPARWYYWCDRLGLLVWQDMPNGDRHIRPGEPDIQRTDASEANYRREWQRIVKALDNHPSIVTWVPFNEGWGQFKTNEILDWTKQLDPTRLVDGPSGWQDRGGGDMHDMHKYPGPDMPQPEPRRAVVLGEFGGLGWPVEGHLWLKDGNWGYRTYHSAEELRNHYDQLVQQLRPLVGEGLAAAIYTQTTDVEGEVNGLMTYDRKLVKMDAKSLAELHAKLYAPPPIRTVLIPTSERAPQAWRYTTSKPADGWEQPDFRDSDWKSGPGGFGTKGTPGSVVRTEWNGSDIWLRREFEATESITQLTLRIHHDEDAQVFLNGKQILDVKGYTTSYEEISLANAASIVRQGRNVLAVHCHQTGGGQYIDVGLVDWMESAAEAD
ncbi:MAG: hypothetical protein KDA62_12150, partial [Planctomycetales bacterium]|nr:hypothetical protein [Planctomycetales bacterium]